MPTRVTCDTIHPSFGSYAQGVVVPAGARFVLTSGQLGIGPDGAVPEGAYDQARLCLSNALAIVEAGGLGLRDVVRLNAFVTDRAHMADYMRARDDWLAGTDHLPASTLVIVSGFTRPEFLVEVEMSAAG
jgi:enamine deaminase RidA (YjgF/YER057c/UK114 family)